MCLTMTIYKFPLGMRSYIMSFPCFVSINFRQSIYSATESRTVTYPVCFVHCVVTCCRDLPSSFKGSFGKIMYTLEANLSRSMRVDSKAKAQFTLVHSPKLHSDPVLMVPTFQHTLTHAHPVCLLFDIAAVMGSNTVSC